MLPPFIIDQIRQREERERTIRDQPAIHLPMPQRRPLTPPMDEPHVPGESDRGVIIIDL